MTPEQEQALLNATAQGIDDDLRAAYQRLVTLIREGVPPLDAVALVHETFTGQYAQLMADGFSALLAMSVGTESVLDMPVGEIKLSAKLHAQGIETGRLVRGIVERHAKGFVDVRKLALEIYEGYDFRADEPLKITPQNRALPKMMRQELLTEPGLRGELSQYFGRLYAERIKTPALRAAYMEYLDTIEDWAGRKALDKKLETVYFERMRYFANRIAQTEMHRAYSARVALELGADEDVEWVQWRMSPNHPETDICDYYAKVDRYGKGGGVYPKNAAPVAPAHPHCRCVLRPRLDLTGSERKPRIDGADRAYLGGLPEAEAARVMGSRNRLDMAMRSGDAWAVHNSTVDPLYRVKRLEQVERSQARI